jgi:hypothetical protein
MKLSRAAGVFLLFVPFITSGFGQSSTATISGTVKDASGALVPGVTITATNTATNVASTALTNESGAYNIPALLPGTYTVVAQLPGFQTARFTDVLVRSTAQIRLDFTLKIADVASTVEVAVSADQLLLESSSSVGEVLKRQEVRDLPLVVDNVLNLTQVMAGVVLETNETAFGAEDTTFAGVSAMNVNVVRDGVSVQDQRWPTGISGSTVVNPELVGEIQIILAPVDAEM